MCLQGGKEGRKEGGRAGGREEGKKEGRKAGINSSTLLYQMTAVTEKAFLLQHHQTNFFLHLLIDPQNPSNDLSFPYNEYAVNTLPSPFPVSFSKPVPLMLLAALSSMP